MLRYPYQPKFSVIEDVGREPFLAALRPGNNLDYFWPPEAQLFKRLSKFFMNSLFFSSASAAQKTLSAKREKASHKCFHRSSNDILPRARTVSIKL